MSKHNIRIYTNIYKPSIPYDLKDVRTLVSIVDTQTNCNPQCAIWTGNVTPSVLFGFRKEFITRAISQDGFYLNDKLISIQERSKSNILGTVIWHNKEFLLTEEIKPPKKEK